MHECMHVVVCARVCHLLFPHVGLQPWLHSVVIQGFHEIIILVINVALELLLFQ